MRLVHDADANIEAIGIGNLLDVPGCAREFADDAERGVYGDIRVAMLVIETPDGMHQIQWGQAISRFEAIGMLEAAKIISFQGNFEED